MCFPQPKTPRIAATPKLPAIKPIELAETGKGPAQTELRDEKKEVSYGAKSLRKLSSKKKTDSASLMVPLNKQPNSSSGINV